jgi:hypothetical protein
MKDTKALLKEAIADAKTVRETALAQAKLALEEAMAPRLQSMFQTKLQEEYDKDEKDLEEMEDKMAKENMMDDIPMEGETQEEYADRDNSIDEIDLDEILAELENELNEAKGEESEEEIEAEEEVEDVADDAKEDEEEDKEVKDLSMDELESLIRDIISQETGDGEGYEDEMAVDAMDDMGDAEMAVDGAEEDFDLEEILAELMGEKESRAERAKVDKYEYEKGKRAGELDERKKYGGNKGDIPSADRGTDKKDTAEEEGKEDYKKKKMEEELQLALEAVNTLRSELNEVNLLNAKLLYVNKIFKAKNLNESQKLTVIKAFDKAESAKEAKLVYESLSTTFTAKVEKRQIKESLGFASKAAGVAAKPLIVESNDFVTRMQKLANIK